MGNSTRGTVTFDAGGKKYTLQYSTNALCELEDAADLPLADILTGMAKSMSIRTARLLFWAGLGDNHEITTKEAGLLMDKMGGVAGIMPVIEKAIAASMPEDTSEGKTKGAA
ncbi:MAG: hypothetical protein GXP05_04400 [Alphaproteobacteria bacterium]|nr:hypothetical protein [Alphaproteobacteria bacterium]